MTEQGYTLQAIARQFASSFESAEGDARSYRRLRDDAPEWARTIVFDAHDRGSMLPDDWRYSCIESAADAIADTAEHDLDDAAHEFADGFVDVYTSARLEWLASHSLRAEYVNDAVQEYCASGSATDVPGLVEMIGLGQYAEALEVFGQVLAALRELCEASHDRD